MKSQEQELTDCLYVLYNIHPEKITRAAAGAGSDTYFITSGNQKYVIKFPSTSEMNHPEQEPELCEYLTQRGIPACQFVRNKDGAFLSHDTTGRVFHLQRFIEGKMYELNEGPDWLLSEQAKMLGQIHTVLKSYQGLPEGIGKGFFQYMTPANAKSSYQNTLKTAMENGDAAIAADLQYRIQLMEHFPKYSFDLSRLTLSPTHGDFFISQILCSNQKINAVIDWTTACVHPVIWEIMRSYVYAAPECAQGTISIARFVKYVQEYMAYAPLSEEDLNCMAALFFYQISVCDYYNQYYTSDADNRSIYLHQAHFSTNLMKWFEQNIYEITSASRDSLQI